MANADLSGGANAFRNGRFSAFINWFGAILSVALITALGVWGYRLATQDISDIPVIRAVEGPMRVAPEDPGGKQAEHQGLAVNLVAAGGGVEDPADRLVLAPEPADLTDEDLPRSRIDQAAPEPQSQPSDSGNLENQPDMAVSQELAQESTEAGLPSSEDELAEEQEEASPDSENGLTRSPFPSPRPSGDLAAQSIALAVARSHLGQSAEVEPSGIPAGTPLVQLGAYDSSETARSEWVRLKSQFPDFLRGRNWFVEETVSGGQSFFRLRATGFDSLDDSKRFCSLIFAEGQECIAVEMRQ